MVVMDSGLGGIAVVRALRELSPQIAITYVADTAGFPYGKRTIGDLTARSVAMIEALLVQQPVSDVILACNTLSTLCLAELRKAFTQIRFVGTVPAIKVAAGISTTRRFTLLATPNTAHSSYSRDLVAQFASDCVVDHYGAPKLARLIEAHLLGEKVAAGAWRAEITPAFFADDHGKTDAVILGCTHYPLALDVLRQHAPWNVTWIDASEAIAKHALSQCTVHAAPSHAFVSGEDVARYSHFFRSEGFSATGPLRVAALS